MNREIKFRAYSPKWKKMIHPNGEYSIDVHGHTIWRDTADDESAILMQYTGLKDKNGVEIYEGDILEYQPAINRRMLESSRFVMRWKTDVGAWCDYAPKDRFAVIGNVYENPELLEAK